MSFQGVNRLFVIWCENNAQQKNYKQHFLPTVKVKDHNVLIDERNVFDQPVKNDLRTYCNIQKLANAPGDD